jgi:lysophospholipase L1-like esterase
MPDHRPHRLFSFGTLRDPNVQARLFGGPVPMEPAALSGHATRTILITDPEVVALSGLDRHLALERREGSSIDGVVLHLTDADLAAADDYEVDDYVRRAVRLTSGASAWAYVDADPMRAAERIVLLGDSIAYGRCDPAGGWAARLAAAHIARDETRRRFFSLAVPGATLAEVAAEAPAVLPLRRPDTVLVAAGINDAAQGALDGIAPALDLLAAAAAEADARLVVIGPLWLDEPRAAELGWAGFTLAAARHLAEIQRDWCAAHDADFVDLFEALEDRPTLFADGIHPTPEGHAILAQRLAG